MGKILLYSCFIPGGKATIEPIFRGGGGQGATVRERLLYNTGVQCSFVTV